MRPGYLLTIAGLFAALPAAAGDPQSESCPAKDSCLTLPFLKVFFNRPAVQTLVEVSVLIHAGSSEVRGNLARPATDQRLPAVLILPGENGLAAPSLKAAREVAGIGFVALAIDYDPEHLAGASSLLQAVTGGQLRERVDAAVDWLAGQPFVDPGRVGALGWAEGGSWVLQLAEQGKLRAGVVSGVNACTQTDQLLQIRATPLLVLASRRSGCTPEKARALQRRISAAGLPHTIRFTDRAFAEPRGPAPSDDQIWVDIYEFLGKHVEDAAAAKTGRLLPSETPIASVVDIMLAINSDQGLRGRLSRSLSSPPSGEPAWAQARSEAAVLAEAGNQLLALGPPKGPLAGWRERVLEFRGAAETLLRAIERRDFPAIQDALRVLPKSCASCHADFR